MGLFDGVAATPSEIATSLPGDDILALPDVVMDRAFTLPRTSRGRVAVAGAAREAACGLVPAGRVERASHGHDARFEMSIHGGSGWQSVT